MAEHDSTTVVGWERKTCGECMFRVPSPSHSKQAVPDWAPDWAKAQAAEKWVAVQECRRLPPTSGIDEGGYRYPEVVESTPACAMWREAPARG